MENRIDKLFLLSLSYIIIWRTDWMVTMSLTGDFPALPWASVLLTRVGLDGIHWPHLNKMSCFQRLHLPHLTPGLFPLTHSKLLYCISLQIKSPGPICGRLQPLQTALAPWHGRVPLPPPWIPGATSQLCWFPARMTLQTRSNPLCGFPTPMTQ